MQPGLLLLLALLLGCALPPDGIQAVRYDGPPLTQADAVRLDNFGEPMGWQRDSPFLRPSVAELTTGGLCGDECNETTTLTFRTRADSGLPVLTTASTVVTDQFADGPETFALDVVRVEIQDWGPDVYSGRLLVADDERGTPRPPLLFWASE